MAGELQDLISKHSAVVSLLSNRGRGNVPMQAAMAPRQLSGGMMVDGGHSIRAGLMTDLNPNVQYALHGRPVQIRRRAIMTDVQYPWTQIAVLSVLEGMEVAVNMGKAQVISLVKAITDNLYESAFQFVSEDLFSTGVGDDGDQIDGLQHHVSDNGQGTVGGLNSTDRTLWRSQVQSLPDQNETASPAAVKRNYKVAVRKCIRNRDKCDLNVTTGDIYDKLDEAMEGGYEHMDAETAKFGFQHIVCKGVPVVWDEFCPDDRSFFLNSKTLKFVTHRTRNLRQTGAVREPYNQDIQVRHYHLMCQLVSLNRARNLVLKTA